MHMLMKVRAFYKFLIISLYIFINDLILFIEKSEICNFVDDNTLYSVGKKIENVISDLKTSLFGMDSFRIKSLKAKPVKFQFMVLRNKDERVFYIYANNVNPIKDKFYKRRK